MRTGRFLTISAACAAFVSSVLIAPAGATPALAADPANRGLFGVQDPTYDGVDRQSAAILGLISIGAAVPKPAVSWLLRQQCEDGSFSAYRADTSAACPAPDLAAYTGPNTNSTALAAMALRALASHGPDGKQVARRAAQRAVSWLVAQQQDDGGWEWLAGLGADSTSTAMALTAIANRSGAPHRRGTAWLANAMQAGTNCGVPFTPDSTIVDPLSTSWAFLATQGSPPYAHHRGDRTLIPCSQPKADLRATGSWLASSLIEGSGQIPSAFDPGQADWNVTALATLGLTQRNGSTRAMRLGINALQANVDAYVVKEGADRATPLGTLLALAAAANANPRDFGGANLHRRLLATMQG